MQAGVVFPGAMAIFVHKSTDSNHDQTHHCPDRLHPYPDEMQPAHRTCHPFITEG